ncbi:Gfo/Idh/MocA family protein [Actinoplanes sp. NPDC048988]|uniref:Gfo/Idh/MocA family protein n=1 Tax=Actinoplanes sp. NPDC048988 TaxID=3363901 RepID=UPI003722DE39
MPYSIALVGCGLAAELFHVPALRAMADRLHVRWVVDPRADRRQLIGAMLPGEPELLPDPDALDTGGREPDLVVLASPTASHVPLLADHFRGAAILCEKPVAARAAQARTALQRRSAGAIPAGPVAVVHSELFRPAVARLLTLLDTGVIGRAHTVNAGHHLTAPPEHVPQRLPWRLAPDGGGVLADLAYHLAYLSVAVLGRPLASTQALFATPPGAVVEHEALVHLAGVSGTEATIEVSWLAATPRWWLAVDGTQGAIRVDDYRQLKVCGPDGLWRAEPVDEPAGGHYSALYAAAADALATGHAPGTPADAGLQVLDLLDSARSIAVERG